MKLMDAATAVVAKRTLRQQIVFHHRCPIFPTPSKTLPLEEKCPLPRKIYACGSGRPQRCPNPICFLPREKLPPVKFLGVA